MLSEVARAGGLGACISRERRNKCSGEISDVIDAFEYSANSDNAVVANGFALNLPHGALTHDVEQTRFVFER